MQYINSPLVHSFRFSVLKLCSTRHFDALQADSSRAQHANGIAYSSVYFCTEWEFALSSSVTVFFVVVSMEINNRHYFCNILIIHDIWLCFMMNIVRCMCSNKCALLEAPFQHLKTENECSIILHLETIHCQVGSYKMSRKCNTYTNLTVFFI